jgi:ribonuclease E
MNLQAAKEIARQLRLRDLGGVIVNDFIDMRDEKHRRGVEKALRDAVKRDRARTKILRSSQFGIIEMRRQRIRPSLKRSVYQDCAHCIGTGQVKTTESMSIDVMRMLQLAVHRPNIQRIDIKVHRDVANYLQNRKRKSINQLEESGNTSVYILGDPLAPPEQLDFVCYDNNNNEVKFLPVEEPQRSRRR